MSAPASWGGEKLGLELENSVGPIWALTDRCREYGCATPLGISLRAGYELAPFASVGLRAAAALGPEGRAFCPGPNCGGTEGYRAASVLVDGRLHTLGNTQLVLGAATGIARLIRLQCRCEELYETSGSRLPVLELVLGVRTYLPLRPVHIGLEARYSALFGAESAYADFVGRRVPQSGLIVSSIAASFVLGASL